MKEKGNQSFRFVMKHYEDGKMNSQEAYHKVMRRTKHTTGGSAHKFWKVQWRRHWAGVAASFVMLAVFATTVVWTSQTSKEEAVVESRKIAPRQAGEIRTFHYDATPINTVLNDLSAYYGVALEASDTTKCLSGDLMAGDLDETILVISETLDIEIKNLLVESEFSDGKNTE